MIESIQISGIATYGNDPVKFSDLSKLNFVFGSNGSGKTTITRVIADEDKFPACKVSWKGGNKLQSMVYNRYFVERNFNQSPSLKGIFTLGEKNLSILNDIDTAKKKLDEIQKEIDKLTTVFQGVDGQSGKNGELSKLEEEFKENCWAIYTKYKSTILVHAFDDFRNSKQKFKDKILVEAKYNTALLESDLFVLKSRSQTIFGKNPVTESIIQPIDLLVEKVIAHESNP